MDKEIINYFHHIHHMQKKDDELRHEVHHCGGNHVKVNSRLDYTIQHCKCKKHRIDKKKALGHDIDDELVFVFSEPCPEGGYHVESGIIIDILGKDKKIKDNEGNKK